MPLKKYTTKLTTLFLSTILVLASTPIVSASEELSDDEMESMEEEILLDEEDTDSEVMTLSLPGEANLSDGLNETTPKNINDLEGETLLNNPDTDDDETVGDEEPVPTPEQDLDPETDPEPEPDPDPEPDLDSEPDPIVPDPAPEEPEAPELPVDEETLPETTIEPILEPNPIEPNASEVSGVANPGAHVIVIYPGTDKQRATTVDSDGNWLIRNVGGDRAYLTEGSTVPMNLRLMDNGQEHTYSYAFQVGDSSTTDLIEESQMVYVSNNTETNSLQNRPSSTVESTHTPEEEHELLPATGEEKTLDVLAFASISTGIGLIFVEQLKRKHA